MSDNNSQKKKKILKIAGIVILLLFFIFSVVSLLYIRYAFNDMFGRTSPRKYSAYICYEDVKDQYERELLTFLSGDNKLQGYLYGVKNEKGIVVISHGMGGGAESYLEETLYFVNHGYMVFSYDNTGCYESEGKNSVGLSQSVLDLDAALTFLESNERFASLPVFLYGHSWGGYAVTAIFNFDHNIAASVSVAGFNEPMAMILEWTKDMMGKLAYLEYPYIYLYQKILFGKNANLSAVDGLNSTNTPVLIIHGNSDTTVGFYGAGTIAYKDKITNPNIQYKICEKESQSGHNNLYMSVDAISYINMLNEEYEKLYKQYDKNIPDEVQKEFYDGIDKKRASSLDEEFMQQVIDFYESV